MPPRPLSQNLGFLRQQPEYPGSSMAGQLKGFEILSPKHLPPRLLLTPVALYFRACLQHVEDHPAPPRQPRGQSQSDRVRLGVAPIHDRGRSGTERNVTAACLNRSGAARLAAIPAGESPANRGVQLLL